MSERVWCVPAALVERLTGGQACGPAPAGWAEVVQAQGAFIARDQAETDETWRQIIPYILLRSPEGGYFTYRRLPASGEARLVDKHSIGVGGHINDEHLVAGLTIREPGLRPNLVADGLARELREELVLPDAGELGELRLLGWLALNETPVDRVHVGVVVVLDVAADQVAHCGVRETDKLEAVGWWSPAVLAARLADTTFEGWSRTLIEAGLP